MGNRIVTRWRAMVAGAAIALVVLAAAGAATAIGPAPPINDNYIDSLELNRPHTPLNSTDTLKDIRNTQGATTQTDLFNPPSHGGPAEITRCDGASYGHTIWYDFYPDISGSVRIRTSGYNNLITLYQFDPKSLVPDGPSRKCAHHGNFPSQELDAQVTAGKSYTIQIGGVSGASGQLEFLFDYFVAAPTQLNPQPALAVRASATSATVLSLTVKSENNTKIVVSCGRYCHPETQTIGKTGSTTATFPKLKGISLPLKAQVKIAVTAPNAVGTTFVYTVVPHNIDKQTFCTEPGSTKLMRSCK